MKFLPLLLFLPCLLLGTEITFTEMKNDPKKMEKYHLKEVEIWGFLHQGEEGTWVLSPEPKLRTCCIKSEEKIFEQISLVPPFEGEASPYPVKVKGIFKVDPKENDWKGYFQYYTMENPEIEETSPGRSAVFLLLLGAVTAIVLIVIYLYSRHQS